MRYNRTRPGLCLLGLILALPLTTSPDDFAWPDLPVARAAERFFLLFNSSDLDGMQQFLARYRVFGDDLDAETLRSRAQEVLGAHMQTGKLNPVEIVEQTDHRIVVLTQPEQVPMQLQCSFALEGVEDESKLTELLLTPAGMQRPGADREWHTHDWNALEELLTRGLEATGVPGIAAVIMEDGQITHAAAVGVRMVGEEDAITVDDRFHIGSITKSMTATVLAGLIDSGALRWDSTLEELLPGFDMLDAYRGVTIEELLQHRAGLPAMTSMNQDDAMRLNALEGTETEIREQFVRELLTETPVAEVGEASTYSNAGYALAGHIAERVSGKAWSRLVEETIFDPLQFRSGGFGWPATPNRTDQPRGHSFMGESYSPMPFGVYELGAYLDPAGDIHCSIKELARYGQAHLEGMYGNDGLLSASTIRRLHTSLRPELDDTPYACGWVVRDAGEANEVHWHNGSAGTFFAQLELEPQANRVIAIVVNAGMGGQDIADKIAGAIRANTSQSAVQK